MPGRRVAAAARSSTAGRTGPSRAARRAWPTCSFGEDGELGGPVAKNLSEAERGRAGRAGAGAAARRRVFFAAGRALRRARSCSARPGWRSAARCGLIDESAWTFLWVVDAPMFEPTTATGGWTAVHHPFTAPNAEWADTLPRRDPGEALAYAYDIVCNGNEIGGGSIRIHRREMQQRVFDMLGISARGGARQVRLPARGVQLRPAAARRHRVRLGPDLHAARRRRLDPRGHRVPEDGFRRRPADRRADADHRAAAQGGRRRRQVQGAGDAKPRAGACSRMR